MKRRCPPCTESYQQEQARRQAEMQERYEREVRERREAEQREAEERRAWAAAALADPDVVVLDVVIRADARLTSESVSANARRQSPHRGRRLR
ncbi:hypothetical protein GCM10027168_45020 [Streptomyces capparidis]